MKPTQLLLNGGVRVLTRGQHSIDEGLREAATTTCHPLIIMHRGTPLRLRLGRPRIVFLTWRTRGASRTRTALGGRGVSGMRDPRVHMRLSIGSRCHYAVTCCVCLALITRLPLQPQPMRTIIIIALDLSLRPRGMRLRLMRQFAFPRVVVIPA